MGVEKLPNKTVEDCILRTDKRQVGIPSFPLSQHDWAKQNILIFCFVLFVFKRGSHGVQADPELTMGLRKTFNY